MTKEDTKKIAKDKTPRSFRLSQPNLVQTPLEYVFFNRFAIVEDDGFTILYLGAVLQGELVNCLAVAVATADLIQAFAVSKEYIQQLGTVSQEPPKDWSYPRTRLKIGLANVIELSCTGDVGEITFSNFGIHELAMVRQGLSRELPGLKLAAARSNLATHRQLVGNLFKGMEKA